MAKKIEGIIGDYKIVLNPNVILEDYFKDNKNSTYNKVLLEIIWMYAISKVENKAERVFFQNKHFESKCKVAKSTVQKALWKIEKLDGIIKRNWDLQTKKRFIEIDETKAIEMMSLLPIDQAYKEAKRGSRKRRFVNRRIFSIRLHIGSKLLASVKEQQLRKKAFNDYCKTQSERYVYVAPMPTADNISEAINVIAKELLLQSR
ncbi:hypothetical protein LJC17_01445 [Acholeplasma sp. OttesenSCG-928-E16]|nr:hypothetical protein [Acholeplasma sp. OttesenSCG-928-E16]